MGHGAEDMKYRFQWNFPIFFSPHNPDKLYTASNHLHLTTDEGQTWKVISPDLTRNDPSTLKSSGGPITQDNTSVEYYGTIFAAIESPYEENLLWTGSDDGLIHMSKDGGDNWQNVTPKEMPKWLMINSIEAIPNIKGGVYIAGTAYKSGDYRPYIYKTTDYGQSWTKVTAGIANDHFTRVVRVDPVKPNLLYAGTETGMYISFNAGEQWQSLQLNLPIVPITDLTIKDNHLIAATQGRGFWLIDDLTVFHQLASAKAYMAEENHRNYLFKPKITYRIGGRSRENKTAGTNMSSGVISYFYLADTAALDTVKLIFKELDGDTIQVFSSRPNKKTNERELKIKEGSNELIWDMEYQGAKGFDGMILWWSSLAGPVALPGVYELELHVDSEIITQPFEIVKDPRSSATNEDLQAQFDFQKRVVDKLTETNNSISTIRKVRDQIKMVLEKTDEDSIQSYGKQILSDIKEIEESLYQTKNKSGQDPLNYPIRLNNKLGHLNSLMGMGDNPPTTSAMEFYNEVNAEIDRYLDGLNVIIKNEIPAFNELVQQNHINAVNIE